MKRMTEPEEWEAITRRSTEDLLVNLALNARVSLFANFVGEFSDVSSTYAGTGGVRFTW